MRTLAFLLVASLALFSCTRQIPARTADLPALAARSRQHATTIRLVGGATAPGSVDGDLGQVRLRFAAREITVPMRLVESFRVSEPAPPRQKLIGMAIGSLAGGIIGALIGAATTPRCEPDDFVDGLFCPVEELGDGIERGMIGGAVGMGVGALLGYVIGSTPRGVEVRF